MSLAELLRQITGGEVETRDRPPRSSYTLAAESGIATVDGPWTMGSIRTDEDDVRAEVRVCGTSNLVSIETSVCDADGVSPDIGALVDLDPERAREVAAALEQVADEIEDGGDGA